MPTLLLISSFSPSILSFSLSLALVSLSVVSATSFALPSALNKELNPPKDTVFKMLPTPSTRLFPIAIGTSKLKALFNSPFTAPRIVSISEVKRFSMPSLKRSRSAKTPSIISPPISPPRASPTLFPNTFVAVPASSFPIVLERLSSPNIFAILLAPPRMPLILPLPSCCNPLTRLSIFSRTRFAASLTLLFLSVRFV